MIVVTAETAQPLVIGKDAAGRYEVVAPWPKLARIAVIDASFGRVTHCGATVRFDVDNGHAVYRPKRHDGTAWICELVESSLREQVH